ncbi:MAG: 2-C-methyl-D-erythritol 4-phosphate cytidylyltransferase [Clostridia bacterium]|nr:2-C-methyl-D-erythritol 4-phosphate cytidylyltransferase [Clostridia bacterium]
MNLAAILASGRGSRMGADVPKQFLKLGDAPILAVSLKAFLGSGLIDAAVVTVPADFVGETEEMLRRHLPDTDIPVHVIGGGASRGESLIKALEFLAARYGKNHIVLTHDAVRPFIDARIIRDNIEAAAQYGAANTCVPATDTVFLSEDGAFMGQTPPRATVFHSQTPQTFRLGEFLDAVKRLPAGVFETLTDGSSVYTYLGLPVRLVPGSPDNVKITFPRDLDRAARKEPSPDA